MTKPEWGEKRTCQACHARFYDMERSPIVCPKCGHEFAPAVAVVSDAPVTPVDDPAPAKAKRIVDGEELDLDDVDLADAELDDTTDDEDDLIEDMSELEHDEDDMSEVMEHIEAPDDV